jgi:hypothetical protein
MRSEVDSSPMLRRRKSEAKPLRLKSGEVPSLSIRLRPGNDPSDAGCNTSLCFPHCRH